MKPQQTLQDIILQNNKKSDLPSTNTALPRKKYDINFKQPLLFILYATILWLSIRVLSAKFHWPTFSYIETALLYGSAIIIKKIFK